MQGTLLLTRAEINRLRRNRRYLIFTLALPVVLYLIVAKQGKAAYGVDFTAYYMVAMATFGAFSGALNGNAIRISEERKVGWIRQLRLTPLPANAYVVAKLLVSMVTTVPSVVVVLLLGRFYGGVHLAIWEWIVIAIIVWLGSMIFAALAVAIGYRFQPDQVQPVAMVIYFAFTILGGIWFPLGGALQKVGEITPTYQAVKISTDVIGGTSVSAGLVIGLVVWLAIFGGLATLAVRATAETM
ncbi:MAG TPA: ABC transporter permease [Trebonia sp.]|jgi:ABC-2 type transport system permease protein|nr:ABC transporter permease [Trebonia sp.]